MHHDPKSNPLVYIKTKIVFEFKFVQWKIYLEPYLYLSTTMTQVYAESFDVKIKPTFISPLYHCY
jgi:hypothetical protein